VSVRRLCRATAAMACEIGCRVPYSELPEDIETVLE
jgi:hypothetical protein